MKLYIYELNNGKICKKHSEMEIYGIENRLSDIYEFRAKNYVYRPLSLINYGENYLFSFKEYTI